MNRIALVTLIGVTSLMAVGMVRTRYRTMRYYRRGAIEAMLYLLPMWGVFKSLAIAMRRWPDRHFCDLGQHYTMRRTHWVEDGRGVPVLDGCAKCDPPTPAYFDYCEKCDRLDDLAGTGFCHICAAAA